MKTSGSSPAVDPLNLLTVVLIVMCGLLPGIVSLWQLRRSRRVGPVVWTAGSDGFTAPRVSRLLLDAPPDLRYHEGLGYFVGDLSCEFNARSPHLRCAVNPCGPCQGCRSYHPKALADVVHEKS